MLEQQVGTEVKVLSTIDRIQRFDKLVRVMLSMSGDAGFPIIFFDEAVFADSGIRRFAGEPIVVRGEVSRYEKGRYRTLQIVVSDPKQILTPELPTSL